MKTIIKGFIVLNVIFAALVTYCMNALTHGGFELWETVVAFLAVLLWPITLPIFFLLTSNQDIPKPPESKDER